MSIPSPPEPSASTGPGPADDPLSDVIAGRRARDGLGHGQFRVADDAAVLCLTCRQDFPAEGIDADDVDRLEGASNPDDMMMVLPIRCPHCGTSGPLIVRYGPEASAPEAEFLVALSRRPAERGRSPTL